MMIFMERCSVVDPVLRLMQAHAERIVKDVPEYDKLVIFEAVLQWRNLLSAKFSEALETQSLGARDVPIGPQGDARGRNSARLVPVDKVVNQFLCQACGLALQRSQRFEVISTKCIFRT